MCARHQRRVGPPFNGAGTKAYRTRRITGSAAPADQRFTAEKAAKTNAV